MGLGDPLLTHSDLMGDMRGKGLRGTGLWTADGNVTD
jgi:hypothetical protein